MSILTPVVADTDGVALTLVAAAASQTFLCGANVFLVIKNADAAPHNCVINDPNTPAPAGATAFDPDDTITVAAGTTVVAGPFLRQRFGDASGIAAITWSATTSMTVGVVRL